jgi:hypothetical protein
VGRLPVTGYQLPVAGCQSLAEGSPISAAESRHLFDVIATSSDKQVFTGNREIISHTILCCPVFFPFSFDQQRP